MVNLAVRKCWNVSSYKNQYWVKKQFISSRGAEVDNDLFVKWQDVEARGNLTRLQEASDQDQYYTLKRLARTVQDIVNCRPLRRAAWGQDEGLVEGGAGHFSLWL